MLNDLEKRALPETLECRSEGEKLTISGYAIRYNERSEPLEWGFHEVIKPGAFAESISKRNILGLYNHDTRELLGTTKANTLRLEDRSDGLHFELDLLPQHETLYNLVKRGDLANCSFGFKCDKDRFTHQDATDLREVEKGTLFEISLVPLPAYPTTSVSARSLEEYKKFKGENEMENKEKKQEQREEIGIGAAVGGSTKLSEEVRCYLPGEKMAPEERNEVTVGGLIRGYVTGKYTEAEQRMMTTTTNGGNFLVPHAILNQLIDLARNNSVLLSNATMVDMKNNKTVSVPKVIADPTAHFKKEGEVINPSDPTFGEVRLEAKYLYGLVEVPLELIKTGIGIEEKINMLLAQTVAQVLDKAGYNGAVDGFTGIFNEDIQKLDITAANYDEVLKGVKAVAKQNGTPTSLIYSTDTMYDIETAKDANGQYLAAPKFYNDINKNSTNQLPNDQILVGDLTQVYVGLLQDMQIEVSTHYGFNKGTVGIRVMWYGDVNVARPNHLALLTVA